MRVLLAVIFGCLMVPAQARETISIVWGFGMASNQAQSVRVLIEEMNAMQNRYQFVLLHRPGAGGTIAANAVADSPNTTVVAMSSSFIIRPLFEKKEPTHNLDDFRPILVQGNGTPLVYVSQKFNSMQEVLKSGQELTVGVSGVGSVSHLATTALAGSGTKLNIVNFKNNQEAATAAAGGHIDLAVGFLSDLQPLLETAKVRVLAYTGRADIPGYPGLQLDRLGVKDAGQLTANYAIFASNRMQSDRFHEIHGLMLRAQASARVRENYAKDLLEIPSLNPAQSLEWYRAQRIFWQRQVDKVTPAK